MSGHRLRIAVLASLLLSTFLPSMSRSAPASAMAPKFSLPSVNGVADLDSLQGRVVYVDFWASWCAPCRGSFPWMGSLRDRFGPRGLTVVAINLDKERELANRFLAEHPATFTVAFDPGGKTAEAYHVRAMPTSFVVDRDGHILLTHAGFDPRKTGEIEARIEEALSR